MRLVFIIRKFNGRQSCAVTRCSWSACSFTDLRILAIKQLRTRRTVLGDYWKSYARGGNLKLKTNVFQPNHRGKFNEKRNDVHRHSIVRQGAVCLKMECSIKKLIVLETHLRMNFCSTSVRLLYWYGILRVNAVFVLLDGIHNSCHC